MNRWWEAFVGLRYVRSRTRNGFLSFISRISILGIAIGVAVLLIVLSVVNGFEQELRSRLLAMSADATIQGDFAPLADWQALGDTAVAHPEVTAVAPYISEQGLLVYGERYSGIEVRGVDPIAERRVSGVERFASDGALSSLTSRAYNIVLGDALAAELGVAVGDTVTLLIADGVVTPAGVVPRLRRFTVSGTFRAGMYEFDRRLAMVNLDDAARLFRYRDTVSGLRLKVTDVFFASRVVREAAITLDRPVRVSDWSRRHSTFFRSIQVTKSILFVILSLVVAVAAFNIVSTLVMVVRDKQRDIAILRTAGASPRNVLTVFLCQGAAIGLVGTALGLLIGVVVVSNFATIIATIEALLGTELLADDVYFISDLPAQLARDDVIRVTVVAICLSLVATLYPAWRAARTAPADALRYD
ncbi:MAG: lipoprotein-releasing ABC transporter permease subunit [Pseudomonadota bacterium]